jgi:hypothetical protein
MDDKAPSGGHRSPAPIERQTVLGAAIRDIGKKFTVSPVRRFLRLHLSAAHLAGRG